MDPQNTGAIVLDGRETVPDTPADLLISDYVGDDGEEPSYDPNDWLYKLLQHNPDIKLLDIDTQQPIHSIGMYKKKNCYIAVNIKNIGGKTTEGNGKERLHLFSQSYLITTLPKYVLPYYERLTPTKGLPIGKLAYNEQKVAAGLFNWELPEKKLKATAERLKEAFPSVNNPIWGFDILAIADENGSSIIKSTADTVFIAHGAEDIARRYNSAAMGYWQRRTLWDEIFNQIIRILPTANKPFSLSLSQPVDIKRGRIKDFAEVNILLSNNLMAKLITAGNPNIKVIDQNRVRLLSADAKLEFRPMSNNKEDYFAGVEVKFFSDLLPQINSFDFGLSYSEQGKEPEMVHFTAIRNSSVYFKAQAEASKTQVAGNETVTLTATNIGDEATYTWYNRSGNVIGTGTSITTVPTATDTYTLEVEREDNGYKSYGEVEVVALAGKIVSLSPNPAHSTLTVKYKLPDNAVIASIQITNIQNNISKTYAISTTATEKTISLEGLSVGSYIVKLIADGKTLHSQNLLIK
ncbi:MAG: T9SS C-terminal target domain-containing protein [Bacteroidetes bacterium]|nr:MAG: T9SS C-terminal target domain-containing protein [Bacteroidota bacterium]